MSNSKLWTKDFLLGTFINFFLLFNYYLLMVIITAYSIEHFHVSHSIAGLTASIFIIGALVARFFSGKWIEQIGRKKMLLSGVLIELIMSITYFFINGIESLFIIRTLHGMAYGMASTAISTIVTSIVPKDRQGEGIGYYMLSITMGSAVGPFLGIFLIQHGGFPVIFTVCTGIIMLCLLNVIFLSVPKVNIEKIISVEKTKFNLKDFFEIKAVPISLVCALIFFCYSSLLSFLASFTKELHLQTAASFFFTVYSLAILISRPFTGRLFDKKGERVTMYPAFLSFLLGMIILSQTHSGLTLLTAGAFLGFGVGVIQSSGLAIAVQSIPTERLGLVNSTFYIFIDTGVGLGPLLLGTLIPYLGYRGMYFSMSAITIFAAFLYYVVWKRKQKTKAPKIPLKI